jgi:hypothetical protein
MNLTTFLNNYTHKSTFLFQYRVWIFVAEDYPVLFFSSLLSRDRFASMQRLSVAEIYSIESLSCYLAMSFLGELSTYWLGDITLGALPGKELMSYLGQYKGPHHLIAFSSAVVPAQDTDKEMLIITLDDKIDKECYRALITFIARDDHAHVSATRRIAETFTDDIFERVTMISLEQACLMLHYQQVLGKRSDAFFNDWFAKIIIPDRSLFNLSQHFFAKNKKIFFEQWCQWAPAYTEEFWTVFWAEQLWQASWFVICMAQREQEVAKQTKRLPFSFTQRDWRRYSPKELITAHNRICKIDYDIKNGGGLSALELFFVEFMHQRFMI